MDATLAPVALEVTGPDGPVPHGLRRALELRVRNAGDDVLVLERAVTDGPSDGAVEWLARPDGLVVYDAGTDTYRHHTGLATRAAVPLCYGVVGPRRTANTLLPVKSLAVGRRAVRVTVTGWVVPAAEVHARLYVAPESMAGAVVVLTRGATPDDPLAGVVARVEGCARFEAVATLEVDTADDEAHPAEGAVARAGAEAVLVERVRRLGGAWVVEAAGGVWLDAPARTLALRHDLVDARVWRVLDEAPAFEPVLVMFRGPGAEALRDEGGLPLEGPNPIQRRLAARDLWSLLEAVAARGLRLGWGRHSLHNDGLIVRDAPAPAPG